MNQFSQAEINAVYRAIYERRDMRHFIKAPLPDGALTRLNNAAHHAPSVGYMQPWRFIRITDPELRQRLYQQVIDEQDCTAKALPSRNDEFKKVKIEGMRECAELLAVVLMPERGRHLIGRRLLPEMDIASVGCAIQNMWLSARAEGIGLGWVSFFDPDKIGKTLALPEGAKTLALLCIGQVAEFYPCPMFETTGWGKRLPINEVVFENQWPEHARSTPTAY